MNKISLKTEREILRDNELKNILGGSGNNENCCYKGTANILGQWVYYNHCGFENESYCGYLEREFEWKSDFECHC